MLYSSAASTIARWRWRSSLVMVRLLRLRFPAHPRQSFHRMTGEDLHAVFVSRLNNRALALEVVTRHGSAPSTSLPCTPSSILSSHARRRSPCCIRQPPQQSRAGVGGRHSSWFGSFDFASLHTLVNRITASP